MTIETLNKTIETLMNTDITKFKETVILCLDEPVCYQNMSDWKLAERELERKTTEVISKIINMYSHEDVGMNTIPTGDPEFNSIDFFTLRERVNQTLWRIGSDYLFVSKDDGLVHSKIDCGWTGTTKNDVEYFINYRLKDCTHFFDFVMIDDEVANILGVNEKKIVL